MKTRIAATLAVLLLLIGAGCSKNNPEKAKQETEAGIIILNAVDPERPDAKQIDEALKRLETATQIDPKYAKAHCAIGTANRFMKQYSKAIKSYSEAIRLDPGYTVCIDNLGLAYYQSGDLEKAERFFQKAIATKPGYADAHYNLGRLYAQQQKKDQAVQEYGVFIAKTDDPQLARDAQKIMDGLKQQ